MFSTLRTAVRFYSTSVTPSKLKSALPTAPRPPQKFKKQKIRSGIVSKPLVIPQLDLVKKPQDPRDGEVISITTAESYSFSTLLQVLQNKGHFSQAVNLLGAAIHLPYASVDKKSTGEIFIFESGSVVSWGLARDDLNAFVSKVIRASADENRIWVEQNRYLDPEMEALYYRVNPNIETTHMSGDTIVFPNPIVSSISSDIPSPDLLSRLAYSAGLSRVTKLGVYEEMFDVFSNATRGISEELENGSKNPLVKRDIIRRVGTLHGFRQKLNLEDESLLDEPEFLWENEALYKQYMSICEALEFDERLTTLNQQVDYAFQLQETLMNLLDTNTSHRLEWIIILLIAFEITLVLIREGKDFAAHMGLGKPDETSNIQSTSQEVSVVI